jgi:hypothetical protein
MVRNGRNILFLSCCLLILADAARAQISPGELSRGHAALEGMGNCTKCHSLGKAVSPDNCLSCHTELRSRIVAGTGFHASVKGKQCVECHKEHHGRNFAIVRFDTKAFDHASTGFVLEGKHRVLDCAKCHTAAKITAADVRQNKGLIEGHTYLGLPRDCKSCHADIHRAQMGNQCQQCHTLEAWKPASRFVHDRAKFRLTGKHVDVACAKCHPVMPDDRKTVKFVGLEFEKCQACHQDPHKGKFQKPCESCHSTAGWREGASKNFNHALTKFPLRGAHANVRCEACHVPARNAAGKLTQNFAVAKYQKCSDCHADAHKGEFASRADRGACESCHTEKGFVPAQFAHATTRFVLKGKHETTECAKCHRGGSVDARGKKVPPDFRVKLFKACADCHEESHGGQFARRPDRGACESCHTVDGFTPPVYSPSDHARARFTLVGEHQAVPCGKCHPAGKVKGKSSRQFVWAEQQKCIACHADPHAGQFSDLRFGGCEGCHSVEGFKKVKFSHDGTRFPLTGKHIGVACEGCHKETTKLGSKTVRKFTGAPLRCVDCHPQIDLQSSGSRRP